MKRVVCIPIRPTVEQSSLLLETANQFTQAFNIACKTGWEHNEKNAVNLHKFCYHPSRKLLPNLASDYHVQAIRKASAAISTAFTFIKRGKKSSCPNSKLCPPLMNGGTFKMFWDQHLVRISTIKGRINIPIIIPRCYLEAIKNGRVCTGDLIFRNGAWIIHVSLDIPRPQVSSLFKNFVAGVDLGINHPAVVTTQRTFLGEKRWKDIENKTFRQRRKLQKKGTQSARRKLKRIRKKQSRFRTNCDHVLSKRIVQNMLPGGTIVLENLTDIRNRTGVSKRQRRRVHSWSFARLKKFIQYKAENFGIKLVLIDPRHTSQTCSKCGYQHRLNRKTQSLFHCRSCGFQLNADLNAARNIRDKHLASFGTSLGSRPSSTGPTSSRTQSSDRRSPRSPNLGGGQLQAASKPSSS